MTAVISAGPQYAKARHIRVHKPPNDRHHTTYRDCLRLEFAFTCAYCLSIESEVGPTDAFGGYEVEHFKPKGRGVFRRLRGKYWNLLWACHACNRAKGKKWPSSSEAAAGMQFVDPCAEPLGSHLQVTGDRVVAVGGSRAGDYMIDEINLNSRLHVLRRRRRAELAKRIALLEAMCDVQRRRMPAGAPGEKEVLFELSRIATEVAGLRSLCVPTTPPWDAPTDCLCPTASP